MTGDLLLPVYCNPLREGRSLPETSMVLRCRFDGTTLRYVEHGNGLTYPTGRGYGEPSLANDVTLSAELYLVKA